MMRFVNFVNMLTICIFSPYDVCWSFLIKSVLYIVIVNCYLLYQLSGEYVGG